MAANSQLVSQLSSDSLRAPPVSEALLPVNLQSVKCPIPKTYKVPAEDFAELFVKVQLVTHKSELRSTLIYPTPESVPAVLFMKVECSIVAPNELRSTPESLSAWLSMNVDWVIVNS